ncbi:MAG: DUF4382 domain-containing protein [Sphingobacteriales bacterium]|nr:MAG: DUF4382 domain-containing protein [Sphingobacteriales bacterium]
MISVKNLTYATALFLAATAFSSCSKDEESTNNGTGKAKLQIRLTDAPGDYEEVNVDIQSVKIHSSGSANDNDAGWQTLTVINPGLYNLLDFANGADTLLVSADLPEGTISQIRLILGDDNSVKLNDGTTHDLTTPSAQQSGLKLQVHTELKKDVTYKMLLDFDAAKSIVKTGNGKYKLKPVIRVITDAVAGGIKGDVQPDTLNPAIYVLNGNDTVAGGFTTSTGEFLIRGINAGTYSVSFDSSVDTFDKVVPGVVVTNTGITDMGVVTMP